LIFLPIIAFEVNPCSHGAVPPCGRAQYCWERLDTAETKYHYGVGRGCGVGLGLGAGVALGVGEGVGVGVGPPA